MKEIVDKLSQLDTRLDSIDQTLVRQEENLKEHMRRTAMLEKQIKPVISHVEQVKGAGKLIAILSLVATVATAIFLAAG